MTRTEAPLAPPPSVRGEPVDAELAALPEPPRRARTLSLAGLVVGGVMAIGLAVSLAGEARFALAPADAVDLGDLAHAAPAPALAERVVHGTGLMSATGAIRFSRPFERDTFRVAPVAGSDRVWVEIRVPEGAEGPRFIPPTSFVGRFVRLSDAGLRHRGLADVVRDATGKAPPADAWLLVDGAIPATSRWTLALVALLVVTAAACFTTAARLVRPARG